MKIKIKFYDPAKPDFEYEGNICEGCGLTFCVAKDGELLDHFLTDDIFRVIITD